MVRIFRDREDNALYYYDDISWHQDSSGYIELIDLDIEDEDNDGYTEELL